MLGLFATLNLGTRALQAQQTGVAVSGQNLSNINNPAYARQRVDLQTSPGVLTAVGMQGTGVDVAAIQQIRSAMLDGEVCDEASVGGYWDAQQSGLQSAQTALSEFLDQSAAGVNGAASAGSAANTQGLSAQLTQLFNDFQSVSAEPTSLPQRQTLVSQAQTLAGAFNQASTRLSSVNDDLNASIDGDVSSANDLLQQITELNKEIAQNETPGGGSANDLRDTREQDLESLAKLVNFQTSTSSTGTLSLSIDGQTLIDGAQQLDSLQTYDAGGGQLLVRTATAGTPLNLTGGSIQGAISTRDGALTSLRNGLDALASQLITQVNSVYQTGYDLNGNTGAAFFTGTDAATIAVNSALFTDPSQVQAAGVAGAPGDNSVALALAQMANQAQAGLSNQTFTGAYNGLVVSLGNSLSNANNQMANHNAVNTMLLNQRDSVSGVSLEEEMSNLMTYQKAYQASSHIISTVDQMLDELLSTVS